MNIRVQALESITYAVNQEALTWIYDELVIETVPIEHSLCGALTYEATFMGGSISAGSTPVSHDDSLRSFTIFTDDPAFKGSQEYTVSAYLT